MTATFGNVGILVRFEKHPNYPDAHNGLNQLYGGLIPDIGPLFVDPDNREDIKEDAHDILVSMVVDIVLENATNNNDHDVRQLLNECPIKIAPCPGKAATRLAGVRALNAAMNGNIQAKSGEPIDLQISVIRLNFPEMCNYTNWTEFSTDPSRMPKPPATIQDLITALTKTGVTGGSSFGPGTTPIPATTAPSALLFNPAVLDPDVRESYMHRRENKIITKDRVSGNFDNGLRYAENGQRLILRDGTLFIMDQPLDEKGLLREPVTCHEDTHAGIRLWYVTLMRHAINHGVYVHPLWLFQKNHGGHWGFSAGATVTDDLPQRMVIPLDQMSQPLFRLLSKKGMFPSGSNVHSILLANYGDGYKALKQILLLCHPMYLEQSSTMLTQYPRQREKSLVEYHLLFNDFLQLRAIIMNIDSSLDSADELNIFIRNAKYYGFLNRATRDERTSKNPDVMCKYTSAQIVETLTAFLSAADSPTQNTPTLSTLPRTPASSTPIRNSRLPSRRVNEINVSDTEDGNYALDVTETEPDESITELIHDLNTMDVPDNYESFRIHSLYTRSLCAIKASDTNSAPTNCIVCGGTHRFDGCEILMRNSRSARGKEHSLDISLTPQAISCGTTMLPIELRLRSMLGLMKE